MESHSKKHNTRKRKLLIMLSCVCFALLAVFLYDSSKIGKQIDGYKGVPVYHNGILYTRSHGRNYSDSDYYYGQKWQCVEYIKRFYDQALHHQMPDVYGNAIDFFDLSVGHGQLNERRGLIQYMNGENMPPQPDDLLVFTDSRYGHVAIITEVTEKDIEVIQQNILGKPRDRLSLIMENDQFIVEGKRKPIAWLRLKEAQTVPIRRYD